MDENTKDTFTNRWNKDISPSESPLAGVVTDGEAAEKRRAVEDKLMELELKRIEEQGYE